MIPPLHPEFNFLIFISQKLLLNIKDVEYLSYFLSWVVYLSYFRFYE